IDARFYAAAWHTFLMNQTFAAFVMIIAVMVLAFYLYVRSGAVEGVERSQIMPILVASSNILALTSLSLEAIGHFEREIQTATIKEADTLRLAQQLSISLIWAVYGGAMLIVGIWRRNRMLRVMSLVLLGATIVKVFLVDLSSLKRIYLTISLVALGI